MLAVEYGSETNLNELREQLTRQVVLVLGGISFMLAWVALVMNFTAFVALSGFFLLCIFVYRLSTNHPQAARHMFVWGSTILLVVASGYFSETWLPALALPLIFIHSMLVTGSGFILSLSLVGMITGLTLMGMRQFPLLFLNILLLLSSVLAWLVVRIFFTALAWAWNMQQRANVLLEVARDNQGQLARTLKSLDLSNSLLRRTQEELIVARKQAEEAQVMKEQFVANVSHELRTPLNLILGFSEVMCLSSEVYGDFTWPPALRQDIYQIYRSSRHLLEMIDDVLDLSRFELTGFSLSKELSPLPPLLEEIKHIAEAIFRGGSIQYTANISNNLPDLEIDRVRIRQVLINLIKNAVRFTEKGEVNLSVWEEKGEVHFAVRDTGVGIPEDKIPHLFQEFFQVDRTLRRKHEGAGLGLAISKNFVEAHGGRIWVSSKVGVGSTFTFVIPTPEKQALMSFRGMTRSVEYQLSNPKPRLLVVDLDASVASLVERHLPDYDVFHAQPGANIPAMIGQFHPRAILVNVLPASHNYRSTIELAESIKHNSGAAIPVIECSLPSQAWIANYMSVTGCLTKPISIQSFQDQIGRVSAIERLMVLDDDRAFCRLIERMIASAYPGMKLKQAYSGETGLKAIKAFKPDLLLLDLELPDISGFEVLEQLRLNPKFKNLAVVLVTGTSLAENYISQFGSGLTVYHQIGMKTKATLACLDAIVQQLQPRYQSEGSR